MEISIETFESGRRGEKDLENDVSQNSDFFNNGNNRVIFIYCILLYVQF